MNREEGFPLSKAWKPLLQTMKKWRKALLFKEKWHSSDHLEPALLWTKPTVDL
jgi:hypothetical protein